MVQFGEALQGHPCTGGYITREIFYDLKQEDKEAINLLDEAKINYTLVDLADCPFTMQLKAKIKGINETPTLIFNGKKIKGAKNIQQILPKIKSIKQ